MKDLDEAKVTLRKMVEAGAQTKSARNYLQAITHLQDNISAARIKGASPDYLDNLRRLGRQAIETDFIDSQKVERQAYQEAMEGLKADYIKNAEKDFQLSDYRLRNFERRIHGMDSKELEGLASDYANGNVSYDDPAMTDSLSAVLLDRKLNSENELVRKIAVQNSYDQPWLKTDAAKVFNGRMKLLENSDPTFLADDGTTFGMEFDELWDVLEPEPEAENE